MSGKIHVNHEGLNEVISTLGVWSGPISYKTTARLEGVLHEFFEDTQARTHIITGSLKASGHVSSDYDGDLWTGEVTYGGAMWRVPTPGPANDPVDYAIYEMARGGEHDFFAGGPAYIDKFEDVVNEWIPEAK